MTFSVLAAHAAHDKRKVKMSGCEEKKANTARVVGRGSHTEGWDVRKSTEHAHKDSSHGVGRSYGEMEEA